MKITQEKVNAMSLSQLEEKGNVLSETNHEAALCLYRYWLERELVQPSDSCFLTGKPEINSDLDRDYTYLLYINQRYDEILEYYKKTKEINTFQGLEGHSRMIKDKDAAVDFIEKALLFCPKDDSYYDSLVDNLEEIRNPKPRVPLFIDDVDREQSFDFIEFDSGSEYVPHSGSLPSEATLPLGSSRYGGPIVDLPKGINYPKDLLFVASLDLAEFTKFDKKGLLPTQGQLYFFWASDQSSHHTFYVDVPNDDLVRVVKEHQDNFFTGHPIENIRTGQEIFSDRYCDDDEYEIEENEGDTEWLYKGLVWDSFAGADSSKLFGIFTHPQYDPNDIAVKTFSDKVLLLQIGENGFNDEGVLTVMIDKEDLQNLDFTNCSYEWGQT